MKLSAKWFLWFTGIGIYVMCLGGIFYYNLFKWTFDERADDGLAAWYALRHFKAVMEDPASTGIAVEPMPTGAAGAAPSSIDPPIEEVQSASAPVDS